MDFLRNDARFDQFLRGLPWWPALPERSRRQIDSLRASRQEQNRTQAISTSQR
jgi:hypothetical protein